MQIIISGQDRSHDVGAEIRHAAHSLQHGDLTDKLSPEMRLLAWRQTSSQEEYQLWIQRLWNVRAQSDEAKAPFMQRPGPLSAAFLRIHVLVQKCIKGWVHGACPPDAGSPIGALSLRAATSEADFTNRLIQLMRYRDNVDSNPFLMPRSPGTAGAMMARLRMAVWRQLRFLVDRIAFRQNHVNTMLTRALQFEHEQRLRETEALQKRVADLEARLK